jgi:hypothetical protein
MAEIEKGASMFANECKVNQFLLKYCHMLTADIADERMAEQPQPGVNHPAWILGHLAYSADGMTGRLGGEKVLPVEWTDLFKPGSTPTANRGDYPAKADLIKAIEESFARTRELVCCSSEETLAVPTPNPRMQEMLPTLRESAAFILTGHFGVHLGQLSMWRRLVGMPALF